jgi:hypothetical protein
MIAECITITYVPGEKTPIQGLPGKKYGTKSRKNGKVIENTGFGHGYEIEGAKVRLWLKIDGEEISYDIKWIIDEHTSWERLNKSRIEKLEKALPESFSTVTYIDDTGNERWRLNVEEIEQWIIGLKL